MASTASPSATPGRRLKVSVTDGKLRLVGDLERTGLAGVDFDQRRQRHDAAGERRFDIEPVERGEVRLQFGQDFQDEEIGIELGVVLRDLALPVGVVEGVVDQLRRDAETGGLIAIDGELELRRIRQQVARGVGKLRQRAHLRQHLLRPLDQFVDIGVLQACTGSCRVRSARRH